MNTRKPLVSIICDSYNHEHFLHDSIEGFLMQNVKFEYEILIHDDASTDKSQVIIREYTEKYPDRIFPIIQVENQYSKGVGIWNTYQFSRVRGKYVALCEGDDYWIDSNKLQKQVDFLETHPDYSMCFHNALEHFEDKSQADRPFSNIENRDYTALEIYDKWQIPTASVMFRSSVLNCEKYYQLFVERRFIFGDITIFLSASTCGKLRGMSDVMSVYRRQASGMTARAFWGKESTQIQLAEMNMELAKVMGKKFMPIAEKNYAQNYLTLFMLSREKGQTNWKYLYEAFFRYPKNIFRFSFKHMHYLKKLFKMIIKR